MRLRLPLTISALLIAVMAAISAWWPAPRPSARVDAGWQRGPTSITLAVGGGVTPPVLADLFFREGVGVRVNPDLRPERVRWEVGAGARRELPHGGHVGLRLFAGRVADMIVWAPDFRFIWSPRNFDVVRRASQELEQFYGRPVRFVHPLSPALRDALIGGASIDLDSIVTILPDDNGEAEFSMHLIGSFIEKYNSCPNNPISKAITSPWDETPETRETPETPETRLTSGTSLTMEHPKHCGT